MPGPAAGLIIAAGPRTSRRLGAVLALGAMGVVLMAGAMAGMIVVTEPAFDTGPGGCVATLAGPGPSGGQSGSGVVWSPEQKANAATIIRAGRDLGAPARAQWIALATAMQESTLRNLNHGDRDSLGLFQQRPSQGWGSPAQVQDPYYAATRFYERLLALPGWDRQPLTVVAQSVQRSAFPGAYARWEQAAADLLAELGESVDSLRCSSATLASGAAAVALGWAAQQLGKPYLWGATGPDAFDCSGLTLRAWQAAGVQLPRTSREQARAGQQIPRALAQPGDLLFWSSNGTIDGVHHVALYLGDNRIREAPTTGVPVRDRELGGAYDDARLLPFAIRPGTAR